MPSVLSYRARKGRKVREFGKIGKLRLAYLFSKESSHEDWEQLLACHLVEILLRPQEDCSVTHTIGCQRRFFESVLGELLEGGAALQDGSLAHFILQVDFAVGEDGGRRE